MGSGQILPHFDINNFSVAQKLTKLDSLVLVQIKLALIIALISHKVCEDIQTSSLATILSWSKLLDRRRGRSKKIILCSPGRSHDQEDQVPGCPHPPLFCPHSQPPRAKTAVRRECQRLHCQGQGHCSIL